MSQPLVWTDQTPPDPAAGSPVYYWWRCDPTGRPFILRCWISADMPLCENPLNRYTNELIDRVGGQWSDRPIDLPLEPGQAVANTGPVTPEERLALTQALGNLMSQFSENNWCAGWMEDNETECPAKAKQVVCDGEDSIGLSLADAMAMVTLANRLGHWANSGDSIGPEYIPWVPGKGPWPESAETV